MRDIPFNNDTNLVSLYVVPTPSVTIFGPHTKCHHLWSLHQASPSVVPTSSVTICCSHIKCHHLYSPHQVSPSEVPTPCVSIRGPHIKCHHCPKFPQYTNSNSVQTLFQPALSAAKLPSPSPWNSTIFFE